MKMTIAQEDLIKTEAINQPFIARVLKPYRKDCCYLKSASFQRQEELGIKGLTMHGEFAIANSCYIDDTGHFNAVEYNICFNQIAYLHLGHSISQGLIPELADFELDSFFDKQLSHFLIAGLSSGFQSLINAKHFYGSFGINSIKRTSKCTFMKTYCEFSDDQSGKSKGEVTLAIMNP